MMRWTSERMTRFRELNPNALEGHRTPLRPAVCQMLKTGIRATSSPYPHRAPTHWYVEYPLAADGDRLGLKTQGGVRRQA